MCFGCKNAMRGCPLGNDASCACEECQLVMSPLLRNVQRSGVVCDDSVARRGSLPIRHTAGGAGLRGGARGSKQISRLTRHVGDSAPMLWKAKGVAMPGSADESVGDIDAATGPPVSPIVDRWNQTVRPLTQQAKRSSVPFSDGA